MADEPNILEDVSDSVKKVNIDTSKTLANVLADKNKSKTKTNMSMNNTNRTKKNMSVNLNKSTSIPKTANEVVAETAGLDKEESNNRTEENDVNIDTMVGDETVTEPEDESVETSVDTSVETSVDEPSEQSPETTTKDDEKPESLVQTTSEEVSEKKNKNINKKQVDSLNQLAINMFNHYIAMKLYHFQTENYSAHKTSDTYIEKFLELKDRFLEVAQGIYGKINLKKYDIKGSSHNDENIFNHINGYIKYLNTGINDVLDDRTDLLNIRDELLSEANQLKYLLTFT